jgi:hypothetical protein
MDHTVSFSTEGALSIQVRPCSFSYEGGRRLVVVKTVPISENPDGITVEIFPDMNQAEEIAYAISSKLNVDRPGLPDAFSPRRLSNGEIIVASNELACTGDEVKRLGYLVGYINSLQVRVP